MAGGENQNNPPEGQQPQANVVATQETPNSIAVGYTANDPLGPQPKAEAETLLAGEFKTPEELAAAYADLKKQLEGRGEEATADDAANGKQKGEQRGEQDDDGQPDQDESSDESSKVAGIEHTDEAVAELKAKGLDVKALTREYESTGQLSDESYAKLEKAGVTRDMVDAYIQGQRVMVESQVKAVKDSIGGEEAFNKVAQWAAANLSEAEQTAYSNVLATADANLITFAVQGLKARYDAANGTDPEIVISGSASPANDGQSCFKSWAEATAAMSDPRYDKDPAYRSGVEAKLLRSNI